MNWERHKRNVLDKDDKSFKGSIDAPVQDLVSIINESSDFLTTSTCSGRIMLINETSKEKRKNESGFLFVSHDYVQEDEFHKIQDCLQDVSGNVFFKLEPLIVHVQCRSLNHATWLLHLMKARDQFKHSCIVSALNEKWIVSIKGMVKLEIPLVFDDVRIVDDTLLSKYIQIANTRMVENFDAIDALTRFFREGHLLHPLADPAPQIDYRSMRPLVVSGKPTTSTLWSPSLLKISERDFSLELSGRFLTDLATNQRIGAKPDSDGSRPSLTQYSSFRTLKDCLVVEADGTIWVLCWSLRKPNLLDFFWLRAQSDSPDLLSIQDIQWVPVETPTITQFSGSYERYGKILVVSQKPDIHQDAWKALCKSKECTAVLFRAVQSNGPLEVLFSSDENLTTEFRNNGVRYRIDFAKFSFRPTGARERLVAEISDNESLVEICDSPNCFGIHLLVKSDRIRKYTFLLPDDDDELAETSIVECLDLNNVQRDKFEILKLSNLSSLDMESVSRVIINSQSGDFSSALRKCTGKIHFVCGAEYDKITQGLKESKNRSDRILERNS